MARKVFTILSACVVPYDVTSDGIYDQIRWNGQDYEVICMMFVGKAKM